MERRLNGTLPDSSNEREFVIEIDGAEKSGSGTLVRFAVALCSLTNQAMHMVRIREKREKQGLRPQHLLAVKACAELSIRAVRRCRGRFQGNQFLSGGKHSHRSFRMGYRDCRFCHHDGLYTDSNRSFWRSGDSFHYPGRPVSGPRANGVSHGESLAASSEADGRHREHESDPSRICAEGKRRTGGLSRTGAGPIETVCTDAKRRNPQGSRDIARLPSGRAVCRTSHGRQES